jgi:hypothetical protein
LQGANATQIALALASLAPEATRELLEDTSLGWKDKLTPLLVTRLEQQVEFMKDFSSPHCQPDICAHLETLFYDSDSVTKAISLYFMNHLDSQRAKQQAQQLLDSALVINPLVRETVQGILKEDTTGLGTVKKLLCLASCELFKPLQVENLMELSYQAQAQEYGAYKIILEEGKQGLELLVLVQGEVEKSSAGKGETLEAISILNEVEILGKIPQTATLRAVDDSTWLISLESRLFEEFFARDRDFARKLLETVITSGTRYDT